MIQKFSHIDSNLTEALIEECIFSQNIAGIWSGIGGKTVLRRNRFVQNKIGMVNAGDLLQKKEAIARTNYFNNNDIADYVGNWDYNEGWMTDFWRWGEDKHAFSKIERAKVKYNDL